MDLWFFLMELFMLLGGAFLLGALALRLRQSPILGYILAGTVVAQPGPPAGTIYLTADPLSICADGESMSTIASEPIVDTYYNIVVDGTPITIASALSTAAARSLVAVTVSGRRYSVR